MKHFLSYPASSTFFSMHRSSFLKFFLLFAVNHEHQKHKLKQLINVPILTMVPDTVVNIIVLDADIGSVNTVCCQISLSHQKQKKKKQEEV